MFERDKYVLFGYRKDASLFIIVEFFWLFEVLTCFIFLFLLLLSLPVLSSSLFISLLVKFDLKCKIWFICLYKVSTLIFKLLVLEWLLLVLLLLNKSNDDTDLVRSLLFPVDVLVNNDELCSLCLKNGDENVFTLLFLWFLSLIISTSSLDWFSIRVLVHLFTKVCCCIWDCWWSNKQITLELLGDE